MSIDQEQHRVLQQVLDKLDALDRKIDRHVGYLTSYLGGDATPPPDTVPGDRKEFKINVENGAFAYVPGLPWQYRPGDQIRWLSESGELTVFIDGSPEFASPFDDPSGRAASGTGQTEIEGRRFKTQFVDNVWQTRQVRVQSLFSDQERQLRRRVRTPPLLYDFTFEIRVGDRVFVETVRSVGSMC